MVSINLDKALTLARSVLAIEARAVAELSEHLDANFGEAVSIVLACTGRVVVSGIGKSGHIAHKIAATLASTGTPAFFVHPAEASHGDLGMITSQDVVLAISNSGESAELVALLPPIKRRGARLIAMTGNAGSTLAAAADVHLDASVAEEACPLGLAPTSSTTAALALGDALAVVLLDARGFTAEDFAKSHPGGKLGRRLLVHVGDVMHQGAQLPLVHEDADLAAALVEMGGKGLGMTAVVDHAGTLKGVFTDGDLRRALSKGVEMSALRVRELMTRAPRTVAANDLAVQAVQIMERHRVNGLLVVDGTGRLIGALNMHDLFRAGVV